MRRDVKEYPIPNALWTCHRHVGIDWNSDLLAQDTLNIGDSKKENTHLRVDSVCALPSL